MAHRLSPGQKLQTESGMSCEVEQFLGGGGQGEVYRVKIAGRPMALKWYFSNSATPEQRQALAELVKRGSPTDKFLWPLELVMQSGAVEFGYLMPLREMRYKGMEVIMKRSVTTSFRNMITACLQLAESYFQLHVGGMCYRDISFGNVFLDPNDGAVLICDNDNVAVDGDLNSSVQGTPRFMAPEIVRHQATPSTKTDLFSLSVLLFYMLMFHHPLEGKKEADIHVFDMAAMTKIYGMEPIFIFDPKDTSNRPEKGYQDNALLFWPIYPQFLRALFTRAFTDGLRDPINGRVRENEWRTALIRLRDSIFYCQHCQAENFYDVDFLATSGGKPAPCWNCKKDVVLPFRIRIGSNVVMLNKDTRLYPHHTDSRKKYVFEPPMAEVTRHPTDPNIWGLKNLSNEKWVLTKPDKSLQDVDKGRNAPLIVEARINFGNIEGEVRY